MKEDAVEASKAAVEASEKALRIAAALTPAQRLQKVAKAEKKGAGAGGGVIESGTHRLSRKKRRRLERLAGLDKVMMRYFDDR
jgi:hypothetical protein